MPELNDLMNISAVREKFNAALKAVSNLDELNEIRVRFTSKKGDLTLLLRSLGKLLPELRKQAGLEVNKLRDEIELKLEETPQGFDAPVHSTLKRPISFGV